MATEKTFYCPAKHEIVIENGYCVECARCYLCQQPLIPSEYFQYCRHFEKYKLTNFKPTHNACWSESEEQSVKGETITIPKSLLDKLNLFLAAVDPDVEASPTVNQTNTETAVARIINNYWGQDMQRAYLAMKKLEAAYQMLHTIIKPHRLEIQKELDERQRNKFKDVDKYRKDHNTTVDDKIAQKKLSKQVQFYMKMGLSESEAEAAVQEQNQAHLKMREAKKEKKEQIQ